MDDYEQAALLAPEVAGYDVGRRLGQGGNASVWLVTAQSGAGRFALKCFAPSAGSSAEDQEREEGMRREVRILSALDHDHLVRAHAVVRLRSGGGLGLVLDFAPGGSLAELIAGRGTLGAGETVTVLTPVAQALAYLHGHGFTHGDVSPGNVLFTAHGKPLLADLGVARMVADAHPTAEAGTEGFRDPAPVDAVRAGLAPERDVYSLAALGWYCLTGRIPGPGADRPPLQLLAPGVPAALVAALESGLKEDRRQRPAAAELAAAIYHSTPASPVDLSVSVHSTVIPQLLTRRALPRSREGRAAKLHGWLHRVSAGTLPGSAREARGAAAARRSTARRSTERRAAGDPGAQPAPRHSGGSPGTSPDRIPGSRRGRRAVTVSLALLLAGAAAAAWLPAGRLAPPFQSFGPAPGTAAVSGRAAPSQSPSPGRGGAAEAGQPGLRALLESADPEDAVRGLAGLRALALRTGDFRLLEQVNVPASPAAVADAGISSRLSASGHVLAGFSTVLTRVEASPGSSPAQALVAISAVSSAYQERDAAGAVVGEAGGAERRMRLLLVRFEGAWRIQDILPDDSPAG